MAVVYVADEDRELCSRFSVYLSLNGLSSEMFLSLSELLRTVQKTPPDVIVMELDYQDGDGMASLKRMHSSVSSSIIVASRRSSESDRIMSFEFGCDDYLIKPYSMKELTLRIIAILKRRNAAGYSFRNAVYRIRQSELVVDWDSHLLNLDGRPVILTASEWKIITYLVTNAGYLISRQQILSQCFPESMESSDRIIDTHIKNIRGKFGVSGTDWIETIRGYGYRFLGKVVKS